jgi:hypothetical protein
MAVPLFKSGRLFDFFAVRFQHGPCHAAAGAAVHHRTVPVLNASLLVHDIRRAAANGIARHGEFLEIPCDRLTAATLLTLPRNEVFAARIESD